MGAGKSVGAWADLSEIERDEIDRQALRILNESLEEYYPITLNIKPIQAFSSNNQQGCG